MILEKKKKKKTTTINGTRKIDSNSMQSRYKQCQKIEAIFCVYLNPLSPAGTCVSQDSKGLKGTQRITLWPAEFKGLKEIYFQYKFLFPFCFPIFFFFFYLRRIQSTVQSTQNSNSKLRSAPQKHTQKILVMINNSFRHVFANERLLFLSPFYINII